MNRKQARPGKIKTRNMVALGAWNHTGSGLHDNRPRRQRTRSAILDAALAEYDYELGDDQ